MKKRVRYITGLTGAGMLPALALTPATTGVAHASTSSGRTGKTGKIARVLAKTNADCEGSVGNHYSSGGLALRFYSKPEGSRTCIGQIEISEPTGASFSRGSIWVHTVNGNFCKTGSIDGAAGTTYCREIFTRTDLHVSASAQYTGPLGSEHRFVINAKYPFKHNGFR
jgi:hypothetical protein